MVEPRVGRALRQFLLSAVLLVLLGLFGLFAWMTRQPGHPFFERMSRTPVAGVVVERLRGPYLPATAPSAGSGPSRDGGAVAADAPDLTGTPPPPEAEWVGIGASVHDAPSASEPRFVTRRLARYEVVGREGSWIGVLLPDGSTGWIDRSRPRDLRPPLGEDPLPPGPLPARPVEEERLDRALAELSGEPRALALAGYRAWTDLPDDTGTERLVELLRRRLSGLEERYRELYGLRPLGTPAETVVLYADSDAYRALQESVEGLQGVGRSAGHTASGLVALAADRSDDEVATTLVHELGHLLNRRALGPGLPAWLGEGLADHLAHLGTGPPEDDPSFRAVLPGGVVVYGGSRASLEALAGGAGEGTLAGIRELLEIDSADFIRGEGAALRYAQAAYLVEFLLADPVLAPRFRDFLQGVAQGGPVDGEALRDTLARPWALLDAQFGLWLDARLARVRESEAAA